MQVRNFVENGLSGSDYLASMAPFSEQPYVHHPPLLNVMHALVGSFLGQGEWQLRLIGYLAGLATVAGLIWLARRLGLRAGPTVLAMALVAGTPMFWIYARLGLGVSLMVILLGLWVRHLGTSGVKPIPSLGSDVPSAAEPSVVILAVVAGAVAFSSWTGALLVAVLAGWGLVHAGSRRTAGLVAGTGAAVVLVTLVWALAVGDGSELVAHAAERRQWPAWDDLVENYRRFYGTLFPGWFRWAIAPALVAAVADRRTRMASGAVVIALGVWTLANPDAAFLHDYWTYPLLVPVMLGVAVILDRLGTGRPGIGGMIGWQRARLLAVAGLVLLAALGFRSLGAYRHAYFDAPSDAGGLIRAVGPAPGQQVAWVAEGVDPLSRWVSYYWDIPVTELTGRELDAIGDEELVLARLDQLPSWMETHPATVARTGRYGLVFGSTLRD
jgi:4-amino-4-deoxy-L-arabinose transferase-like glycosyltransferase